MSKKQILLIADEFTDFFKRFSVHEKYSKASIILQAVESGSVYVALEDSCCVKDKVYHPIFMREIKGAASEAFALQLPIAPLDELLRESIPDGSFPEGSQLTFTLSDAEDAPAGVEVTYNGTVNESGKCDLLGILQGGETFADIPAGDLPLGDKERGIRYNRQGTMTQYSLSIGIDVYVPLNIPGSLAEMDDVLTVYSKKYTPVAKHPGDNFLTNIAPKDKPAGRGRRSKPAPEETNKEGTDMPPKENEITKPELTKPANIQPELPGTESPADPPVASPQGTLEEEQPKRRRSSVEVQEQQRLKAVELLVSMGYTLQPPADKSSVDPAEDDPAEAMAVFSGKIKDGISQIKMDFMQYSAMCVRMQAAWLKLQEETARTKAELDKVKELQKAIQELRLS